MLHKAKFTPHIMLGLTLAYIFIRDTVFIRDRGGQLGLFQTFHLGRFSTYITLSIYTSFFLSSCYIYNHRQQTHTFEAVQSNKLAPFFK
jgi:hypothetical protein